MQMNTIHSITSETSDKLDKNKSARFGQLTKDNVYKEPTPEPNIRSPVGTNYKMRKMKEKM